jgi:hypothetical protein
MWNDMWECQWECNIVLNNVRNICVTINTYSMQVDLRYYAYLNGYFKWPLRTKTYVHVHVSCSTICSKCFLYSQYIDILMARITSASEYTHGLNCKAYLNVTWRWIRSHKALNEPISQEGRRVVVFEQVIQHCVSLVQCIARGCFHQVHKVRRVTESFAICK